MSEDKMVMLIEQFKSLADVQAAVKVRALELLEDMGMAFNHNRKVRILQKTAPSFRVAGKRQPAHTILGLPVIRFRMSQWRGLQQYLQYIHGNSMRTLIAMRRHKYGALAVLSA
jgi:hypothetical protein